MLKYGLKIWSINKDWFGEATALQKRGLIDFIEIYLVPDSFRFADFDVFAQNEIPVMVHSPHTSHDFDVFNLNEKNLAIWKEQIVKTADYLRSPFIITHAGVGDSSEIFQKEAQKLKDRRVLMENMPKIGFVKKTGGVSCFGYSKEQLEFIHEQCGFEICLDVGHAFSSAVAQKKEPEQFARGLISDLQPFYFHICGIGDTQGIGDKHLDLWQSDFDLKWLKGLLVGLSQTKDIFIAFETPKKGKGLENDTRNIDYFIRLNCK
ncbi:MAG: hypothetical protein M1127_02680 [Patescibacteria group bacterium]|nr:hypothetical protein [Patescibacteria group bacterium]